MSLQIRLLGELEVLRDEERVALPASKKSRALLAYLAATGKQHLRERLCALLWEGPDDPRGALRWSLTKLRPVVTPHLIAKRDHVHFDTANAAIDTHRVCNPKVASTEALEECATLFRGEFLDGLDLPSCFRYQQWCVAERERWRQMHVSMLCELVQRFGVSDRALPHARKRVMIDPFDEPAHADLIRLLASLGRAHEALEQYEHCRMVFERELGKRPSQVIEDARRMIGSVLPAASPVRAVEAGGATASRLVGRLPEIETIEKSSRPVLILGEPGIGKSRVLEELVSRARAHGEVALYGRAFASEMIRPYGVWIDTLAPLGGLPDESDRTRLFDAVVQRLSAAKTVMLDDLQWIDEASAALLHYVARATSRNALAIICAARNGELDDNIAAMRVARELKLKEIALQPLTADETRALAQTIDASANIDDIADRSSGNPLFAIELARSQHSGSLSTIISERLAQLDGPSRELVPWAAALGRQFDVEIVGRAIAVPAGEMLAALQKLERASIIRASGDRTYDFTHDLIRDAAYQLISGPRRTLIHRHIARALSETHDPQAALAGEIVHHASLAGDADLAASAAVRAGNRCLRMFAYTDAVNVALRGRQMSESLSGNRRTEIRMELLGVIVMSRTPLRERVAMCSELVDVTEEATRAGLASTAALGSNLIACLNEESNDYTRAARASIESARIGRDADRKTAANTIANTAFCLIHLQREVVRAESLLDEARQMGIESAALALGTGYLLAHYGHPSEATPHLERAFALAGQSQDHWREWIALARLATVSLESGDYAGAAYHCQRMHAVSEKMKGGSEGVRGEVLGVVQRFASGEDVDIEAAIARLREIDSKSDLAWTLAFVAEIEMERGLANDARRHAEEAVVAAEAVGRESDSIIAQTILGKRLSAKESPDLTARARARLKEQKYGHSRARTNV